MSNTGKTYIDPIKESQKSGISPSFPGSQTSSKDSTRAENAASDLREAESSAASDTAASAIGSPVAAARSSEEIIPALFTGSGKNAKGKGKGTFGKIGAISTIIILLCAGGGLLFGASSLLPFHIVEMFETTYGTSYVARQARAPYLLKWVFGLENDEAALTKSKLSIVGKGTYQKFTSKISSKSSELAENGITVFGKNTAITDLPDDIEMPEGTKVRIDNGEIVDVSGSSKQGIIAFYGSDTTFKDDVLIFNDNGKNTLITASNYGDQYRSNSELRNGVNKSMQTWLGRIADWIDESAAKFFLSHNLTKNLFGDWSTKKLQEQGIDIEETIAARTNEEYQIGTGNQYDTEVEEDGVKKTITNKSTETETGKISGTDTVAKITNIGKTASTVVCGVAAVSAAATVLKIAKAKSNAEQYFTAFASAADQAKAGDNGPINELANNLLEKDSNNETALDDQGMEYVLSLGTTTIDSDDETTKLMNIEEMFKNIGMTTGTVVACTIAKAGFAVVSGVLSVVTIGTFSIGKAAIGAVFSTVLGVTISAIVKSALANVTTNFCIDEHGRKRGACMAFGGANTFNGNSIMGGGTAGDKDALLTYYDTKATVLAWEAEYERSTLSPFDITSSNTFLGNIISNVILPLAISMRSGAASTISTIASTTNSSIVAMLPTASAVEKATYLENAIGDCPNLESIGAVGDMYCDVITMTDTSTVAMDPIDVVAKVSTLDGGNNFKTDENGDILLDENGVEIINPDSHLGKYITVCAVDESPYATINYSVLQQDNITFGNNDTISTVANSLPNLIPAGDDALDAINAIEEFTNIGWANKANCVLRSDGATSVAFEGDSVTYTDDSGTTQTDSVEGGSYTILNWEEETKYYRQYVEDDRIMQTSSDEYVSPVMAVLDAYYEENPLDNSYEGILARYSGYTKEQVIAILEEMEYQEYIANYDPSTRYNFITEASYDSASARIAALEPTHITVKKDSGLPENHYAKFVTWEAEKRRDFTFAVA